MLKVGDELICIKEVGGTSLRVGEVYKVDDVTDKSIIVNAYSFTLEISTIDGESWKSFFKLKDSSKKQVGGSHYQLPIQPIDYITKNGLTYSEGNVVKYITRHSYKNGKEDVMKALHYLQFILEHEYDTIVEVIE